MVSHPACIARFTNPNFDIIQPRYELVAPAPVSKWNKKLITYAIGRESRDIAENKPEAIGLNISIESWREEIPLEFRKVSVTQNPDVTVSFVDPLTDPYMKSEPNNIMGYSGYPGTELQGVLMLNDGLNWNWDGSMFRYKFINTFIHELGHILGLPHTPNSTNIIYAIYNGMIDLGADDISMAQEDYGKRIWNSNLYTRLQNWLYYRKRHPYQ